MDLSTLRTLLLNRLIDTPCADTHKTVVANNPSQRRADEARARAFRSKMEMCL